MSGRAELIKAVQLAMAGEHAAARSLVDGMTDDKTACWLLACLAKADGREAEARAWYARSSQFYESFPDPTAELASLYAALTY